MEGVYLRLFTYENDKHKGMLLYDWILEKAKSLEIHGGSAIRAIAGYGRDQILHEAHFFELTNELPVVILFVISQQEAEALMENLEEEGIDLFYAISPVQYGHLSRDQMNP